MLSQFADECEVLFPPLTMLRVRLRCFPRRVHLPPLPPGAPVADRVTRAIAQHDVNCEQKTDCEKEYMCVGVIPLYV